MADYRDEIPSLVLCARCGAMRSIILIPSACFCGETRTKKAPPPAMEVASEHQDQIRLEESHE